MVRASLRRLQWHGSPALGVGDEPRWNRQLDGAGAVLLVAESPPSATVRRAHGKSPFWRRFGGFPGVLAIDWRSDSGYTENLFPSLFVIRNAGPQTATNRRREACRSRFHIAPAEVVFT